MIMPWARPAWQLNNDHRALQTMKTAATTLLSRFSPVVGLIRSWDTCVTRRYKFESPSVDFMTIIVRPFPQARKPILLKRKRDCC